MKTETQQSPLEPRDHDRRDDGAVWEPPTIRLVGKIADLVQLTKRSGTQDCSGRKRFATGNSCT